jgi:hypothetical protein
MLPRLAKIANCQAGPWVQENLLGENLAAMRFLEVFERARGRGIDQENQPHRRKTTP